jgi:F-type H+-transporting ATPase subunit b
MFIISFIIINLVTFLALVFVFRKIMFSSSYAETKRLQELNAENTKKAMELEEKIEEAGRQYKEKIVMAEDEVRKLKERAREEAEKIREQTLAKAKEERERLIGQAINAKEKLREEIEGELLEKSLEFARRIITDILSSGNQRLVYDGFLEEVLADLDQADKTVFHGLDLKSSPQVRTSHPLSPIQKERLEKILSDKTGGIGAHTGIEEIVDKKLIAGVVIQIGSLAIDGSLAAKFRKAAEAVRRGS